MLHLSINAEHQIKSEKKGDELLINDKVAQYELLKISDTKFKIIKSNAIYDIEVLDRAARSIRISVNGEEFNVEIETQIDQLLKELGMHDTGSASVKEIKAPMPGTILSISIESGQEVSKGDPILILEAMKMENVIKSPGDGVIDKLSVNVGDNVEKNQLLVSFE